MRKVLRKVLQRVTKGREEDARQNIELFVEKRFPALLTWTKEQVEQISGLNTLQSILSALFMANTEEEIKMAFPALV